MEYLTAFFDSLFKNDYFLTAIDAILKLGLAALFSGFIGFEREHSHRPAGFRTHILVSVGSALVALTSAYLIRTNPGLNIDPTRMAAQVISGIGFLGAGTIMREGFSVKGLTTAASLWAVSCIGIAVGLGFHAGALIGTLIVYLTLNMLKKIVVKGSFSRVLFLEVSDLAQTVPQISMLINKCGVQLRSMEILYSDSESDEKIKKDSVMIKALIFPKTEEALGLMKNTLVALDGIEDLYID